MISIKSVLGCVAVIAFVFLAGCANVRSSDSKIISKADFGWATPWKFIPGRAGTKKDYFAQNAIKADGDMALELARPGTIERHFPPIDSGILEIEMRLYMEQENSVDNLDTTNKHAKIPYIKATEPYELFIDPNKISGIKAYVSGDDNEWAYRWHCPFAWWETGGNYEMPRFYVCEGKGKKKKGMEYTDFRADSGQWYKIVTILDFATKTWQFWIDDVKFDYPARFGREMAWWHNTSVLNKIRFTNGSQGKSWIDSVKIRHNGKLIAASYFDSPGGYEQHKSIIGPQCNNDLTDSQAKILEHRMIASNLHDTMRCDRFTSLIRTDKGQWYCVYREASRSDSWDGQIRVLRSTDDCASWKTAAIITAPVTNPQTYDLRDPQLSIRPSDGNLVLTSCAFRPSTDSQTFLWFSSDGSNWSEPVNVGEKGEWLWRIVWHNGIAYGFANNNDDTDMDIGFPGPTYIQLYKSTDETVTSLIKWGPKYFASTDPKGTDGIYPNEAAIVFMNDVKDTALCLLRTNGKNTSGNIEDDYAQLGTSYPPYKKWTWQSTGEQIGGPNMIVLPDGRILAGLRLYNPYRISLCWIDPVTAGVKEFLPLPGGEPDGGTTAGYIGMVWHNDLLWLTYYSDHEELKMGQIYFAKIRIPLAKK
ncbi:MAG: sialidase family protein [Planctomycetota bacterium]